MLVLADLPVASLFAMQASQVRYLLVTSRVSWLAWITEQFPALPSCSPPPRPALSSGRARCAQRSARSEHRAPRGIRATPASLSDIATGRRSPCKGVLGRFPVRTGRRHTEVRVNQNKGAVAERELVCSGSVGREGDAWNTWSCCSYFRRLAWCFCSQTLSKIFLVQVGAVLRFT